MRPARLRRRLGCRLGYWALLMLSASSLVGCSARDSGDSTVDGGVTLDANGNPTNGPALGAAEPVTVNFEMFADTIDLQTGSPDVVTITATLIDDNRVPMAATAVEWAASAGVLQDVSQVSDANGLATAVLRMPQDFRNRSVEVSVSSGDFSERIGINAYGTVLDVQGGERSAVVGNDLELAVTLTAGTGEPIINRPLVVTAANGNRIEPAEPLTDANGRATVRIGTELGSDSVTIEALEDPALTRTIAVDVSTDQLAFSTPDGSTDIGVNQFGTIDVTWTSNGQPVVGGELRVTTSAGRLLTDVLPSDADGRVSITVGSSSAGPAQIQVQDAIDGDPAGTFDVEFVATTPALVNLSTTSSRVFVNGRSEVTALVRDADGNPVKNREVSFTSGDLFGGQLSPSSVRTDSQGRARSGFVAGGTASGSEAIEIFVTVPGATGSGGAALSDSVRLSVVERRLNVTLGAGNGLESIGLDTQYAANLVVQVADGSGIPLAEADVALSITPIEYYKGGLLLVDKDGNAEPEVIDGDEPWVPAGWNFDNELTSVTRCPAEDANKNRILDLEDAEDTNGNGILDPQDPVVLAAVEDAEAFATLDGNGTLITDANGTGYFRMIYPKGNALWSRVLITARVNALASEGQDSIEMGLRVLASDLADIGIPPPNRFSPYGSVLDCAVRR